MHVWHEIGAPYEAALARMGLGHAHRADSNEEAAQLEFRAARSAFERVGAVDHATEAAEACGDVPRDDQPGREQRSQARPAADPRLADEKVFRREGEYWCVGFERLTIRLRNLKGLAYLARLLASPWRDFHVLAMVARETGGGVDIDAGSEDGLSICAGLDAGVMLDAQAKKAYRRRLTDIDADCEEALALGDHERAAQAQTERDLLVRELARAVGLGGRDRRAVSISERARASVTLRRLGICKRRWHGESLGRACVAARSQLDKREHETHYRSVSNGIQTIDPVHFFPSQPGPRNTMPGLAPVYFRCS